MSIRFSNSLLVVAVSALLTSPVSAQVVVDLRQLDLNAQFSSIKVVDPLADPPVTEPLGVEGAVDAPFNLGETTSTHFFTVAELDIAGDGLANDTVVFSYDVASTNGTIAGLPRGTNPVFAYGVDGVDDAADNEIDPGEGLAFSNLNATATFGDQPDGSLVIQSAFFNAFDTRFPGGGDIVELSDGNGGAISISTVPDGGPVDRYTFETPQSQFTVIAGSPEIMDPPADPPPADPNGFGVDTISATFTLAFDGDIGVIPGDYDNDGDVDADDVDLLSAQLGNPASVNPRMNLDTDDTITLADHDLHITTLVRDDNGVGALIGDLNLDGDVDVSQIAIGAGGVVNVGDASVLLANLGTETGAGYAQGDLNGDGDVDVSQIAIGPTGVVNLGDASILLANLGQTTDAAPAAAAVPEPGSLSLLAMAAMGLVSRRKRS